MNKVFLLLAATVVLAVAQPALAPPQIGFVQDSGNAFRPVLGIAGNFLLGDAIQTGLNSAGFSGASGMVKTGAAVFAIDGSGNVLGSADAPAGGALFGFSPSGAPEVVYFTDASAWMYWDGQAFQSAAIDLSTFGSLAVVSITSSVDGQADIVVQRDDGLWDVRVIPATGEIAGASAIPGISGPVLALASGELIYRDADGLVVRKPDASEKHIYGPLPANIAFQQMGSRWIQIRDLDTTDQFAVRITENREQIYGLPGVDQ